MAALAQIQILLFICGHDLIVSELLCLEMARVRINLVLVDFLTFTNLPERRSLFLGCISTTKGVLHWYYVDGLGVLVIVVILLTDVLIVPLVIVLLLR